MGSLAEGRVAAADSQRRGHPQPVQFGEVPKQAPRMGIEGGQIDLSGDIQERQPHWLAPTLVGLGLALIAALIYQLIVGGVKIEVTNGRLTIDPSGLIYWWQTARVS